MTGPRRRILVAAHRHCPEEALRQAAVLAGANGEVVLAAVIVVPVTQPLEATLDGPVEQACGVLEAGERLAGAGPAIFDTRLVRARSFAKGVLETLAAETFDALILETGPEGLRNGFGAQALALLERAETTVILVRPSYRIGALEERAH
jgi:universal stress protein family protein